jgi:energy-coupling factor transporter ATP-binding protein EcfA2
MASQGGLSPDQIMIMESQAEEMRRSLLRFKVCSAGPETQGAPGHGDILVFGPSGSGKSSLIRTVYMALHKTQRLPTDFTDRIIVKDTAMNEGTLKYVSAVIKPASLDHRGAVVSSAIMCHDTRGHIWMDEREQKQLGLILDGSVKDDQIVQQRNYRYARLLWEFWRKDTDLFPAEILVRQNGLTTRPHAILFVFDGSMEEIPDGDEETRFYREIIQSLRGRGYLFPQVVLTRIDRIEEQLRTKSSPGSDADQELRLRQVLDRKIEGIVTKLDVPRTSVHFIENYHSGHGSDGRNASVDFHALKILTQCCTHAEAFVAERLKENSGAQRNPQCVHQ